MKAETLKRLFRLIQDAAHPGLSTIAQSIVDDEKKLGHSALASQLEKILTQTKAPVERQLRALPSGQNNSQNFTTLLPPQLLRHHMVLPDRIEARFKRIENEYAARDRLARHGLNYRKRVLLYGPPGCGKTLGAERLAWTTGLPLMKVRFDAVMSSYFGESATNLRSIFDSIRTVPTLLFLDECDFVARSRTSGNDVGEVPRIVNTLLVLLEEYQAPGLLVAATNLDSALDAALFRRFDEVLEVPPPGQEQILQLLRLTLSAIECSPAINWEELGRRLADASAANVVKVAQDAAKSAILSDRLCVTQDDLLESISELRRAD
jgi:SpoVK/Ycf46/Vps4 family AAA+-type ATPase